MTKLERDIMLAAQLYYSTGTSFWSDKEFDEAIAALKVENPDSEVFKLPSWGYKVEEDTTYGERLPHRYGLVEGLPKAYEYKEVKSFLKDGDIWISPKLDGMSVALYYVNGELDLALTRGSYDKGIDITDKMRHVMGTSIPDPNFTGGVRGEIIMSHDSYHQYCQCHDVVKNSRNAVAGIINSKGITSDLRFVRVVVYTVLGQETSNSNSTLMNMEDITKWLYTNFHRCAPYTKIEAPKESEYFNYMKTARELWLENFPYENDGIVATKSVHHDGNNFIYDSQAFKFSSEQKQATVKEVEWNMTKSRLCIPRIRFNTIELDGASVNYATGYHAKYIVDNNIGPGSVIEVSRHGEVIPNVDNILSLSGIETLKLFPHNCPECGSELVWYGVNLVCTNEFCGNAIMQDLLCWLNHICPVDNFGDKLRIKYFKKYIPANLSIESVMNPDPDLLSVSKLDTSNKMIPSQMRLFITMLDKLYNGKVELSEAIKALNIPRLGDKTAYKLSQYPDLVKQCIGLSEDYRIDGTTDPNYLLQLRLDLENAIGNANAKSIIEHITKFSRLRFISNRIIWEYDNVESKGKVAITGKLSVKRSEFEKELKSKGWGVGEISKDTKFLITDNPNSNSSKNKKADEWNIPKVTESEFRKFLEQD